MKKGYILAAVFYTMGFLILTLHTFLPWVMHPLRSFSYGTAGDTKFWLFLMLTTLGNLVIGAIPAWLVSSRWWKTRRESGEFLPPSFQAARRLGYIVGLILSFLGHAIFFGALALIVYYSVAGGGMGLPLGIGVGIALWFYAFGILCVEVSIRRWQRM